MAEECVEKNSLPVTEVTEWLFRKSQSLASFVTWAEGNLLCSVWIRLPTKGKGFLLQLRAVFPEGPCFRQPFEPGEMV